MKKTRKYLMILLLALFTACEKQPIIKTGSGGAYQIEIENYHSPYTQIESLDVTTSQTGAWWENNVLHLQLEHLDENGELESMLTAIIDTWWEYEGNMKASYSLVYKDGTGYQSIHFWEQSPGVDFQNGKEIGSKVDIHINTRYSEYYTFIKEPNLGKISINGHVTATIIANNE